MPGQHVHSLFDTCVWTLSAAPGSTPRRACIPAQQIHDFNRAVDDMIRFCAGKFIQAAKAVAYRNRAQPVGQDGVASGGIGRMASPFPITPMVTSLPARKRSTSTGCRIVSSRIAVR